MITDYNVGVIPFKIENDKIKFIIITRQRQKSWIFPKGHREEGFSDRDMAIIETFEEAGLLGEIIKTHRMVEVDGQLQKMYLFKVSKILEKWPEKRKRSRKKVKYKEALIYLKDKELHKLITWARGIIKEKYS